MKVIHKLILTSLLLLGLIPSVTPAQAITIEEIQAKGELILGTNAEYPPFEWVQMLDGEAEIVGIDIELGQILADKLGVDLVVDNRAFDALIPTLATNKVDIVLAGMSQTEERSKQVAFSIPYYTSVSQFAVVKGEAANYQTIEDFAGKKIGVLQSSIQESYVIEEMPEAEAVSIKKNGDLMEFLKTGRLDAVLIRDMNLAQYLDKYSDSAELVPNLDIVTEGAGMAAALNKDSQELTEFVNEVFNEMIESGQMAEIFDKYIKLSADQIDAAE